MKPVILLNYLAQMKCYHEVVCPSGIRNTARVLKIDKNTVISILKSKEDSLVQVKPIFLSENTESPLDVRLELVCEEAEIGEQ